MAENYDDGWEKWDNYDLRRAIRRMGEDDQNYYGRNYDFLRQKFEEQAPEKFYRLGGEKRVGTNQEINEAIRELEGKMTFPFDIGRVPEARYDIDIYERNGKKVLVYKGEAFAEYQKGWVSNGWVLIDGREDVYEAFKRSVGLSNNYATIEKGDIFQALVKLEELQPGEEGFLRPKNIPELYKDLRLDGDILFYKGIKAARNYKTTRGWDYYADFKKKRGYYDVLRKTIEDASLKYDETVLSFAEKKSGTMLTKEQAETIKNNAIEILTTEFQERENQILGRENKLKLERKELGDKVLNLSRELSEANDNLEQQGKAKSALERDINRMRKDFEKEKKRLRDKQYDEKEKDFEKQLEKLEEEKKKYEGLNQEAEEIKATTSKLQSQLEGEQKSIEEDRKKYNEDLKKYNEDFAAFETKRISDMEDLEKKREENTSIKNELKNRESEIGKSEAEITRIKNLEKDLQIREKELSEKILDFENKQKVEKNKLKIRKMGLQSRRELVREEEHDLLSQWQAVDELWDDNTLRKKALDTRIEELKNEQANLDDELKAQLERSKNIEKQLENELSGVKLDLSSKEADYKKKIADFEEQISTIKTTNNKNVVDKNNEIQELKKQIRKSTEDHNSATNTAQERIKNLNTRIRELNSDKNSLRSQIDEQRASNLEMTERFQKKLDINETSRQRNEAKISEQLSKITQLQTELNLSSQNLSGRETEFVAQLKQKQDELNRVNNQLSKKQKDYNSLIKSQEKQLAEKQREVKKIQVKLNEKEAELNDAIGNSDKNQSQIEKELNEAKSSLRQKQNELTNLTKQRDEQLGSKQQELDEANEKLKNVESEIYTLQNKLTISDEQIKSLNKNAENYNKLVDDYEFQKLANEESEELIQEKELEIKKLETDITEERMRNRQLGTSSDLNKKEIEDKIKIISNLKKQVEFQKDIHNKIVARQNQQDNILLDLGKKLEEQQKQAQKLNDNEAIPPGDIREYRGVKKTYSLVKGNYERMTQQENITQNDIEKMVQDNIKIMEAQVKDFETKTNNTDNELQKQTYEMYKERTEFEIDRLKMDFLDKKPDTPEMIAAVQEEVDNNPEVRFEKFKRFVKENFIGISGALIGIAGIITSIAVGIRSASKTAGGVMQKSGNENSTKGGIQGFVGNVVKNLGKIISWTGDNILLTMAIIIFIIISVRRTRR